MRKFGSERAQLVWQFTIVFGCLFAIALVLVACSSMSSTTPASGMGKVTVSISDPATCQTPNGPFYQVWVTIADVQANTSASAGNSDSGWVDLTPNLKTPMQVNLLGIANNQCFLATLGDAMELQAGSYQQIRIKLAPNSGTIYGSNCTGANNCVVLDSNHSKSYPLLLSSEAQTGIKIPSGQIAGGAFKISAGQTKDLDIDFKTCMSIVTEGNGQYRLKPVLHAGEASTTSVSVNGKVVDAQGNPVEGAIVAIEQPDGSKDPGGNPIDRFITSTVTSSDGTWVICPLVAQIDGDPTKPYDLVITGANSSGVLLAPSIVTGVSMGTTAGTVTLNGSASMTTAAASTATISGQVTSAASATTADVVDVSLSILEAVNHVDYTIPLPATASQIGGQNLTVTTAATANLPAPAPACPNNTDCYDYTLQAQALGAYIGTWGSGGTTLAQPNAVPVYMVDGNATTSTSTPTTTCNPSEQISPAIVFPVGSFTGTTNLAFTGCM
ncbi:MAG TPA: DUF4382 domain-containing protein [Terracidiphilus sp.]|nr:DUF4382 domain-containing protein [Terracidiphilus sp.]